MCYLKAYCFAFAIAAGAMTGYGTVSLLLDIMLIFGGLL